MAREGTAGTRVVTAAINGKRIHTCFHLRVDLQRLKACSKQLPAPFPTPPSTQNPAAAPRVLPVARRPYREPPQRHDLGQMDRICPHCGALHWLLERLMGSRSSDAHLLFTMCCNCGDVELPPIAPPPEQLSYFFTAATPQADRFRQHIHQYNAALAFTSLGVEVDNSVNEGGEVLQHSASMANSAIDLVPSFHVMETIPHTRNYTYMTHTRPSNIGCNGM